MKQTYEAIRSVEDLLSVADAMERESADRYRGFASRLRKQGDANLAVEFETLAALEDRHVGEVANRARAILGRTASPTPVGWRLPQVMEEEDASGALLNAYRAFAFAVRNEERAFAFYTYVAAAAHDQGVRAFAEDLARDELDHASRLRRLRRKAFHQERPVNVEIPEGVPALRKLVQLWEKRAAKAHADLADRLERAGQAKESEIFRRLAMEEESAAADAPVVEAPSLANAEAGLRLLEETFESLSSISERSKDERVVGEAQRLAQGLIARLALARETFRSELTDLRDA